MCPFGLVIPALGAGGPEFKPRNGPSFYYFSQRASVLPLHTLHLTVKDVVGVTSHINSKA